MTPIQVALYARVSSEQQNEANTIDSQLADLRARIAAQGLRLVPEQAFVDNGYRYVSKWESGGEARFEIVLEEARVVRQIFAWVGRDRCSIGEVQRRLHAAKEQTRTGKTVWDRATIWGILKNPAYKGAAAFGKTHLEPLRPRLRAQRGRSMQAKRAHSTHDVPRAQWISIAVPA